MINKIIISIVCLFLFGCSDGIGDHLQFHYKEGQFKNEQFWNPEKSWKNKYKNGDPEQGPAYFGSTTFLAWTRDAWHLFKTIKSTIIQFLIAFLLLWRKRWYWVLIGLFGAKLVVGAGFHLFYTLIL